MKKNIRNKLDEMSAMNQRNDDRVTEKTILTWIEGHMRERLAEIRAREVPAANEHIRQAIIERYEHDLATWVC